ncbi:hypothetical protein XH87_26300 [Bradyrhizobium sp. CCBAU 53415]|nr:hypothetical protein [Bradyrhizobium sp. CCBAU 53415]
MQRLGRRIDAAVGRAMHGQRADTIHGAQWTEAAFVPATGQWIGKKRHLEIKARLYRTGERSQPVGKNRNIFRLARFWLLTIS